MTTDHSVFQYDVTMPVALTPVAMTEDGAEDRKAKCSKSSVFVFYSELMSPPL